MKREKESHLANLARLSAIDGDLDDRELRILQSIAVSHDISPERFQFILRNLRDTPFVPPKSTNLRRRQLGDCVAMIKADGKITPEERILCLAIGKRLGFTEDQVEAGISGKQLGSPGQADNSDVRNKEIKWVAAALSVSTALIVIVWAASFNGKISEQENEIVELNRHLATEMEKLQRLNDETTRVNRRLAQAKSERDVDVSRLSRMETIIETLTSEFGR